MIEEIIDATTDMIEMLDENEIGFVCYKALPDPELLVGLVENMLNVDRAQLLALGERPAENFVD